MKMKQVMSHNINNGLLNIIRRTDPMIIGKTKRNGAIGRKDLWMDPTIFRK